MSETEELIEQLKAVSTKRDTFQSAILAKSAVNSAMAFLCRARGEFAADELSFLARMALPPVAAFVEENQLRAAFDFVSTIGAHASQGRAVTKRQATLAVEHAIGILATVRGKIEPTAPACVFSRTMSEAETRREYIDLYLAEAGWELVGTDGVPMPSKAGTEIEVTGMPPAGAKGYCDYVLYADDGHPIAVVEAKKTARSPDEGRVQVRLYGERLMAQYGCEMPILYYTNGYTIWCMDGVYPDRPLHAFHTKKEIGGLLYRRNRKPMSDFKVNTEIAGRPYQIQAVTKLCEWFNEKHRRGLLVMATGTGKTRVSASLVELLTRNSWVENVLFLADRTELVRQAYEAFTELMPEKTVSVLSDKKNLGEPKTANIVFSTHQTMIRAIDAEKKKFDSGRFDLILIDEAHRSIFNKYGAIFAYFDSLLVGLTATPRDEVDANTYRLFECSVGEPNFSYSMTEGRKDGFLVGWHIRNYTTDILRDGIKYEELSKGEREDYEEGFDTAGYPERPDMVQPSQIFNVVYNEPTCDLMLERLMTEGQKVESGELIGKSIIFAVDHQHAVMIKRRFDALYPCYGAEYCQVIDNHIDKAPQLIKEFKNKRDFRIAVSVDMLDTGVDVPEILNLVFFKKVRSKIKFFQMLGRGTRLAPDVFGPGLAKHHFLCFDFCGNFEYFNAKDGEQETSGVTLSTSQRIFAQRVRLMHVLQDVANQSIPWRAEYWKQLRDGCTDQVAYLRARHSLISVRKAMPLLDTLRKPDDWKLINAERVTKINNQMAPLVVDLESEPEQVKLFDFQMLAAELALATVGTIAGAEREVMKVRKVAKSLLKLGTIEQVMARKVELEKLADAAFWNSATLESVEDLRRQVRELMTYLKDDRVGSVILHIDDTVEAKPAFIGSFDIRTYREKVIDYLADHMLVPVVERIRKLEPIGKEDVAQLELILWKTLGTKEQYEEEKYRGTLVGFVRSLIDLDTAAVQEKFGRFLAEGKLNADQQEFVRSLIEYLRENGEVTPMDLANEEPLCDYPLTSLFEDNMPALNDLLATINSLVPQSAAMMSTGWGAPSEEETDGWYLAAAESGVCSSYGE